MTGVAAVVLAAGTSSRMEGGNKLLADLAGEPVLRRSVSAILKSRVQTVIVVTGHDAEAVTEIIHDLPVQAVRNAQFADGMATSLAKGIAAIPCAAAAALICLGDMPLVGPDLIDALIEAYDPRNHQQIVVPVHSGRRGHPVLWGRGHFADLQMLTGDQGARQLLQRHAANVEEVEAGDDSVFADADTADALVRLRSRFDR